MSLERRGSDSKKASKLLLAIVLTSLLILAFAYVPQASSRPNTTIKIDGDTKDWAGIDPIVTDKIGDEEKNCDLVECYVTNDGSNLYFMIQVCGTVISTVWDMEEENGPSPPYAVGLDTDQDPNTGVRGENPQLDIGVDYLMGGPLHTNDGLDNYFFVVFKVSKVNGEPKFEFVGFFPSAFSNSVVEFSCPLSAIGNPDAIDMVFAGKPLGTDFAPDQTDGANDYVTYEVYVPAPPGRPPPYVGGELYSTDKLAVLAPYIALIGLASTVAMAIKKRRR
ncbi:MAG: hypothetical protein QW176_04800 [Candidatus Bathyarchaeia archaeon]